MAPGPISLSLDPQWSTIGRRIGLRLVQPHCSGTPKGTRSCLTALSRAITGPRLGLPQISVANKLALLGGSFAPTDALILPPILYLWCVRVFPTGLCERILHCAVLPFWCTAADMDLFFSEHAGARTVPDLLEQGQQDPWFPAQRIEGATKLPSMHLY